MSIDKMPKSIDMDIATVDKATLVDLESVEIDSDASSADRVRQYLNQIGNPYIYCVGDIAVKIRYAKEGRPLEDLLFHYLSSLKGNV